MYCDLGRNEDRRGGNTLMYAHHVTVADERRTVGS